MDENIKKKVDIIKASKLFIGNSDRGYLVQKQNILLTLTGQKPVSEITTGKKIVTPTGWKSAPEDHDKIRDFLLSLGLQCSIEDYGNATDATISLDANLLKQYIESDDLGAVNGYLFGFPKTAVEAYGNKDLMMDIDEQDALTESEGLPLFMPCFRFSKLHYKQEIEVMKDWYNTLKMYDLVE